MYFGSSGWADFVAAERILCFDVGLFVLVRPSRFVMRLYGHNGFEKPMSLHSPGSSHFVFPRPPSSPATIHSPTGGPFHVHATTKDSTVPPPPGLDSDVKMRPPAHPSVPRVPRSSSPRTPHPAPVPGSPPVQAHVQGTNY